MQIFIKESQRQRIRRCEERSRGQNQAITDFEGAGTNHEQGTWEPPEAEKSKEMGFPQSCPLKLS
jgi:hypothetical protein